MTTRSDFTKIVDAFARKIIAARPEGIQLNGSNFAAVAGTTGYACVCPTEVARDLQDSTIGTGKRWRNLNHRTVEDALLAAGWTRVYGGRKVFLFLDEAEADRCAEAFDSARAKEKAKWAARRAGLVVRVFYANTRKRSPFSRSHRSSKEVERSIPCTEENVLDVAAKAAKSDKVVRIEVGSYSAGTWMWTRA